MLSIAGRAIGVFAGGAAAALWIAVMWFPVGGFMLEGVAFAFGALMALFALVAAIGSYHGHALVVFFCFVASFFGIGSFALNIDHWFRVFGILDLLLLVASVMIWYSARGGEAAR